MRRSLVSGDVERLVKELVVGHIVANDRPVRLGSLTPSARNIQTAQNLKVERENERERKEEEQISFSHKRTGILRENER